MASQRALLVGDKEYCPFMNTCFCSSFCKKVGAVWSCISCFFFILGFTVHYTFKLVLYVFLRSSYDGRHDKKSVVSSNSNQMTLLLLVL